MITKAGQHMIDHYYKMAQQMVALTATEVLMKEREKCRDSLFYFAKKLETGCPPPQSQLDFLHQQRIDHLQTQNQKMILIPRKWGRVRTAITESNIIRDYLEKEKKEKVMEFKPDYTGYIRKIGDHFLIMIGCEIFIADDLKAAGKAITKLLTEAYKEKDDE